MVMPATGIKMFNMISPGPRKLFANSRPATSKPAKVGLKGGFVVKRCLRKNLPE